MVSHAPIHHVKKANQQIIEIKLAKVCLIGPVGIRNTKKLVRHLIISNQNIIQIRAEYTMLEECSMVKKRI
jgi:hypothetical protein